MLERIVTSCTGGIEILNGTGNIVPVFLGYLGFFRFDLFNIYDYIRLYSMICTKIITDAFLMVLEIRPAPILGPCYNKV